MQGVVSDAAEWAATQLEQVIAAPGPPQLRTMRASGNPPREGSRPSPQGCSPSASGDAQPRSDDRSRSRSPLRSAEAAEADNTGTEGRMGGGRTEGEEPGLAPTPMHEQVQASPSGMPQVFGPVGPQGGGKGNERERRRPRTEVPEAACVEVFSITDEKGQAEGEEREGGGGGSEDAHMKPGWSQATSEAGSCAAGPSFDPGRTPRDEDGLLQKLETRVDQRIHGVEQRLTSILTSHFHEFAAVQRQQGEQLGSERAAGREGPEEG